LPGITEGAAVELSAEARRPRDGRRPTRQRERPRPTDAGGPEGTAAPPVTRVPDGRDDPNLANIFINVGRRDGVNQADLQTLLADDGIPHEETSNIRVRDRMTFVTVKKELAERAIGALAGKTMGGRTVIAEPARERN
jgi:ATP-dependent RNA helicase DeaD